MFRILIIEDEEATSDRLNKRISRKIPEAQVDTAMTVQEAHQFIEAAYEQKEPYDAVVLDIKLPESKGDFPELDESICHSIKDLMPASTIVAHISAYLDDLPVMEHMKKMHDEQIDRSFRLSKLDSDYFKKLESKLKSFLYGTRIENQMDKLFGSNEEPAFSSRNRSTRARSGDERSVTHELASLSRSIAAHWNELDESLQSRIKRTFEVTTKDDRVIVSF